MLMTFFSIEMTLLVSCTTIETQVATHSCSGLASLLPSAGSKL